MPSASQDRFRQTWKLQELSGKPAQAWLVVRRTIATLVALGLIGVCGWLIFSLFWVPKAYLAYWSATSYQPLSAAPVKYACNDFAAIEALKDDFSGSNLVNPAESKLTKEVLEGNLRELSNLGMRSKDACIVFVTAHGGVRNKEAFLLCEPGGRNAELPLSDVFAALKNVPIGTKLLILDAGRDDRSPDLGTTSDNTFPAILEKAVKEADDPALWVLTANAPLERSHVSAELNRPVFGYMVSQGLRGEADRDHDGVIRLDELYNYVQSAVAAWVKTATTGNETQTPQLFHYEGGSSSADQVAQRRLINAKSHAAEPEHATENVAEHEAEEERGGISKWLVERGEEAKERFSVKDDVHIFKHMLGIHEHADHGGAGEGHDAHAGGAGEHGAQGDAEHKNAAHDAKAAAKIESAAAARRQVRNAWQDAAQLEASVNLPSPGVIAPPLWRELLDRLLWCDQFCASGVPAESKASWKQAAKELEGINQSLEAFASYRLPVRVSVAAGEATSLALVDRLAAIDSEKRLAKPQADFIAEYDRLLIQEPPATFKDKLNKLLAAQKTDLGLSNFYEFQLLGLSNDSEVSSATLQLVLRTRRVGETVATSPLCGDGWLRTAVEVADRSRSEGERQLLDRTNNNWEKQATDRLTGAMDGYESAFRNLEFVRGTIQYRNTTLLRAPDLVQRACLNGGDHQETVALQKVFSTLRELNNGLAEPANTNVDVLKRLRDQLENASAVLERKTNPANDSWRMANLLATTLPSPDTRTSLLGELATTEKKQMAAFKVPETESEAVQISAPTEEQWKRATDELALQIDLARLAGCDERSLAPLSKSIEGAESGRIEKLNEVRGQLAELLNKVPSAIAASTDAQGADRAAQITQLRNLLPPWLLLGPEHRDRIDPKNNLMTKLDRVTWQGLLAWNSERFSRAADDAPVSSEPLLSKISTTYHDMANSIPDGPALPQSSPPALSIDSPAQVSLVTADEATVSFKVKSNAGEEKQIWLIAQYNDKWLDADAGVHHQHDLPAIVAAKNLGEKASRFPLRPDLLGLPFTDRLPAGASRDYTVKIKRQPNNDAGGGAKLILKAVSGETFIRREVAIDLPGRESLDVTTNSPPEFWTPARHALHPLPNREQAFTFDVINRAKVAKKLDVSFVAPSRVPGESDLVGIPTGAQKAEVATKILDAYGPLVPLGDNIPVELPASGESVRIKLPANDPRNNPKLNLLLEKPDPEFPGIPLRYGLMILLTDRDNKEVTIRRIEISPQRPTGYLEAVAHYDRATERLQIDVSAKNRDVIPPGGLKISADVTGVSAQLSSSLEGDIKSPNFATSMYAHLSPTSAQEVRANVNVDNYPRAFVFSFLRNTTLRDLTPTTEAEVRIVSPPAGKAYKAPVNALAVTAEVDAPEGAFGEGDTTSNVEFGVDENQDRDLKGDTVEMRRSDRQVSVAAKGLSADGSLTLDTRVSDFHFDLKSGLANRKASLLGRLMVDGKATWSQPVEILLDGAAPIIHAALPPNREVETEEDLVVHVLTHQAVNEIDLSGVQKVEAVFDSIATKDSKPAKWEEAKPDGENSWVVKLSTKEMGQGARTVLVRATDAVGNTSEPLREPVTIVPKRPKTAAAGASKEPPKPDVANVVTGKVQYGNDAVKANVSLESLVGPQVPAVVSDASGKFSFPKVAPGKYTLKAVTPDAIHNRFRHAKMEITVEPKPKVQPPVAVKLE